MLTGAVRLVQLRAQPSRLFAPMSAAACSTSCASNGQHQHLWRTAAVPAAKLLIPPSVIRPFQRFKSDANSVNDDEADEDLVDMEDDDFEDGERRGGGGGGGGKMSSDEAAFAEDGWVSRRLQDHRDRTRKIPVEMSIAYMDSSGYRETYGTEHKVWELYRRNFPGRMHPNPKTRRKCIVYGKVSGGNPCPICRDEYLVVDYRNVKLINQFLTDYNRQMVSAEVSGVCREQYKKLLVAIEKARDHVYLDVDAPFVEYDYEKYKPAAAAKINTA